MKRLFMAWRRRRAKRAWSEAVFRALVASDEGERCKAMIRLRKAERKHRAMQEGAW